MDKYIEMKAIIEDAADKEIVDFAPYGEGTSKERIKKAEERLQICFPESYKWWLLNYGGGEIGGDEIYSIYDVDPNGEAIPAGDIVYINELDRKLFDSPRNMLTICKAEDEILYFDTSIDAADHEYPVYEYYSKEKYADDFFDFLKKRIAEFADWGEINNE